VEVGLYSRFIVSRLQARWRTAAIEEGHFPDGSVRIIAKNVGSTVIGTNLEVLIIGGEPAVDDLVDDHAPFTHAESLGFALAVGARVALHTQHQVAVSPRIVRTVMVVTGRHGAAFISGWYS